jgi:gluconate 2-dehydrogenase gamma chain
MSNKDHVKNSDLPRREFLRKTFALIPIAATVSVGSAALAAEKQHSDSNGVSQHYVPIYFNNDEWAFLLAACDRLIPSDHLGPGAVAEGVPIYIDKQMELPYGHGGLFYMSGPFVEAAPEMGNQSKLTPRETYRIGIKAVNHYCQSQYGKSFIDLTEPQQIETLTKLEKDQAALESISGRAFFALLLQNTKEGYLADPLHGGNQSMASWKLIGFPGARADFTDWVSQPNKRYPLMPVSISSKRSI